MKKNLRIVCALCCLLTSCDDESARVTLLNYNVIDPTFTSSGRRWLYAANKNGEVLAIGEITKAGQFKLEGVSNNDKVDIGYVIMRPAGEKKNWMFSLYKGIEVGSSVDVTLSNPPATTTLGTARVLVRNYKEPVSPLRNLFLSTTFAGGIKSLDWNGEVWNAEITMSNNPTEILVTGLRGNTPVYLKQNVTPGQTIEIDFSTFVPMESIQSLDFIGVTSTAGFKNDEPYSNYFNFENHRVTDYVATTGLLGYVAGYDYYQTLISNVSQSNGVSARGFLKLGEPVSFFRFPEVSISVNDKNVSSFDATFSAPYTFKHATFTYSDGDQSAYLTVHSADDRSLDFIDFPPQFKAMDPLLKVSDLTFSSVRFVSSNDTYTTLDELTGRLTNRAPKKPFEFYSFTALK